MGAAGGGGNPEAPGAAKRGVCFACAAAVRAPDAVATPGARWRTRPPRRSVVLQGRDALRAGQGIAPQGGGAHLGLARVAAGLCAGEKS